jgi:hypothetical protein
MRFWGSVRVPGEAGKGTAKVTLSYPAFQRAEVAPATFELPVAE